jgi:hypothetical protein
MSKLICCYCKKIICEYYDSIEDSHGACPECHDRVMKDLLQTAAKERTEQKTKEEKENE